MAVHEGGSGAMDSEASAACAHNSGMREACLTTAHGVRFDLRDEKTEFNQYWYSTHTIQTLLDEVQQHATACAFLSTPSLYFALVAGDNNSTNNGKDNDEKKAAAVGESTSAPILSSSSPLLAEELKRNSRLFEFDRQWEKEPGFVRYDFHKPEQVPVQYLAAFDYILADPPFITADVWTAYIQTARLLLKPGGKLLFTTVLENHTMLESLLDAPLFIAQFRPTIAHLTYQYVCFTNYIPTRLKCVNPELPPEDAEIMAAVEMANDLRESEQQFTAQMRERSRKGEKPLPTIQHRGNEDSNNNNNNNNNNNSAGDFPPGAMKWGYIPEGLTMYTNGTDVPPEEGGDNNTCDYGDAYREVQTLRATLDNFKRNIDLAQKHLDVLLRLEHKRTKQEGETGESSSSSVLETTETAFAAGRQQLQDTLKSMREMIDAVEMGESRVAAAGGTPPVTMYIVSMKECVEAYATVPVRKQELNELAADATRKYKSPVFNRMNELLQRMKEIKKQYKQQEENEREGGFKDPALLNP